MIDEVTPLETWQALETTPDSWLVDVRTVAEWQFVGMPDLSALDRQVVPVSWQMLDGRQNPRFIEELREAGIEAGQPIYFICRSGARSMAAAHMALSMGLGPVYNVQDGFEGPPDASGKRGNRAGWKAVGLAWRQS